MLKICVKGPPTVSGLRHWLSLKSRFLKHVMLLFAIKISLKLPVKKCKFSHCWIGSLQQQTPALIEPTVDLVTPSPGDTLHRAYRLTRCQTYVLLAYQFICFQMGSHPSHVLDSIPSSEKIK